MESQYQKWVIGSYLAVAALVGYLTFAISLKITGTYDLEAHVRHLDLYIRGFAFLAFGAVFLVLYKNNQANQFMNEAVTELMRVTWPLPKETASATLIVIIMVLISGMILGLLDYSWTKLVQWIL